MLEDDNLDENTEAREFEGGKNWGTSFDIGQTTYATSLFWQPLRNVDDPYLEVEDAAEEVLEGADLFVLKKGKSPQFGLCISSQGYQKGTRAAIPALVGALSEATSFLAVFKVNNGWWYVCVRNDIVLSDGDMLFFNEQDAKDQFSSMLAVPDWNYKIAPAEWNIADTRELNLEEILKQGPKEILQKIHALRGAKLVAAIVVSLVVGIWLLSSIISFIMKPRAPKPIVAPIAIKEVQKTPPPPEPKPWEAIPRPEQILSKCYNGVQDLVTISTPGWKIGGITCTPEGLVTSWKMEIGRLSWIDKALKDSGIVFSSKSISPNGTEVIASMPISRAKTFNSPPTMNGVDLVNTINDLFQGLQMQVSLSSQTWTSPQNKVYKSVKFSFSSKHDPLVWADILTKFSGLMINLIKYDTNTNSWYYEGAIYVL